MNKRFLKTLAGAFALTTTLLLTSCYSVFSGGTGGIIVDAESTSTPKAGIPFVDVYAYTDSGTRDSAYNSWREGTVFSPSNSYYGHTTTDVNGNFTISNIVWKSDKPEFGKDADFTTIYLLYYHENYGLTKGSTVITSDSTSDTVYEELHAIRKTTALTINISYPRWKNQTDKADEKENEPEISITYAQSADTITWKACANADNEAGDYAFLNDDFSITKKIQNSNYSVSFYGKTTRINLPTVSGTYGDTTDVTNDGVKISMKAKDSEGNYTIDCGEVTTYAQTVGNSEKQTHGNFSGLGNGFFFSDSTYPEKNKLIEVQFYADGNIVGTETFRSDSNSYNIRLN